MLPADKFMAGESAGNFSFGEASAGPMAITRGRSRATHCQVPRRVEPLERKGRAGAVSHEALDALAVVLARPRVVITR